MGFLNFKNKKEQMEEERYVITPQSWYLCRDNGWAIRIVLERVCKRYEAGGICT